MSNKNTKRYVNAITVDKLVKRYKKAQENAVDNVSFKVKKGEFFALLGPNGAGKTTTISILTTTLSKTSGKVMIAGYDLDKEQGKVRQNTGIIFQNPSLDLNLTAEENIRFHAILYGLYSFSPFYSLMPKVYKQTVNELAEVLGIDKDLFKPVKTYSGGMKRKLEILRSLLHSPQVLFLDEPTSGLDPLSRKNLWEYLREVREKHSITVFLTTHYLEEAEDADNVCIINHGKVITQGTPIDIKKKLIRSHMVVDSNKKTNLLKELKKMNLSFKEDRHIIIDLTNENAQQVISSIKTPLSYLVIHNPSLEDAYLEIIGHENQNGNGGTTHA